MTLQSPTGLHIIIYSLSSRVIDLAYGLEGWLVEAEKSRGLRRREHLEDAASNVFLSYVTDNKSINCLETTEKIISNLAIALQVQTTPDLVSASIGLGFTV